MSPEEFATTHPGLARELNAVEEALPPVLRGTTQQVWTPELTKQAVSVAILIAGVVTAIVGITGFGWSSWWLLATVVAGLAALGGLLEIEAAVTIRRRLNTMARLYATRGGAR